MTTRTYKAISIWQPYATLLASGAKKFETRTWAPGSLHMGEPVLIHASKRWAEDERDLCLTDPAFFRALSAAKEAGLPWDFGAPTRLHRRRCHLQLGVALGGAASQDQRAGAPLRRLRSGLLGLALP
jgi:hypothetical protein